MKTEARQVDRAQESGVEARLAEAKAVLDQAMRERQEILQGAREDARRIVESARAAEEASADLSHRALRKINDLLDRFTTSSASKTESPGAFADVAQLKAVTIPLQIRS